MKYLTALILILAFTVNQHDRAPVAQVLLEVEKESFGMVSNPGRYLYLRLLSNGQCELEAGTGEKKVILTRKLSAISFDRFKTLLDGEVTRTLATEYAGAPTIDHVDRTTIRINRPEGAQQVVVVNYCPQCNDVQYPEGLITLLCEIKSVRLKTDLRLKNKMPEICSF